MELGNLLTLLLFVGGMIVWGLVENHRIETKIKHKIHEADVQGMFTEEDRAALRKVGYLD